MPANAYASHTQIELGKETRQICEHCLSVFQDKEKKKVHKVLNQIKVLKRRQEEGDALEKTQIEKIAREPKLQETLANLEGKEASHLVLEVVERKRKREQTQEAHGKGTSFHQRYDKDNLTNREIRGGKKQKKGETLDKKKAYQAQSIAEQEAADKEEEDEQYRIAMGQ